MNSKPVGIRVIRSDKRGRKIIIVLESDLYSDETFAVTPFYDEGDKKNQLQALHVGLEVTEQGGVVKTKAFFGNPLSHFTKGHSQIHYPLNSFFIDKKDCARNWIVSTKEEYFTEDKIKQVLQLWESDIQFHSELKALSDERKKFFSDERIKAAQKNYHAALKELESAMGIESFSNKIN